MSFSVNHPVRQARHHTYELRLDTNGGTSAFPRRQVSQDAGLAESTCRLFRSRNSPTDHIRHWNYALRIDPVSTATATDRADATFSIVYWRPGSTPRAAGHSQPATPGTVPRVGGNRRPGAS
ncbi:AbfB domain-containing protein [Streptomyces europaeiscabiei]|uniref:AbfB domain-containing protein n=1 Tax=Streptomyces europaeiscabiei TaxID=146819 RepID=UPI002E2D19A1|nr:AbfB domain-containing protein [Streptomyces europaeiscabiei]